MFDLNRHLNKCHPEAAAGAESAKEKKVATLDKKIFHCIDCDKKYAKYGDLKRHQEKVHGVKLSSDV